MMKKLNLIFSALCAICLAGCNREELSVSLCDNMDVAVNAVRYVDTKAGTGDTAAGEELLCTRQFVTEEGDTLYISAYLSDLKDVLAQQPGEETKGAPIYFNDTNKNLGTLYGTINTTVYDASSGSVYESEDKDGNKKTMKDVEVSFSSDKWSFNDSYYWPKAGGDLYFCSMAPVELLPEGTSPLVSNIAWDKDSKLLTFDYTMPAPGTTEPYNDAVNQKDLLVAVDKNNKSNGSQAKINLCHALTGVRFVMGEATDGVKLKSVSLNNFNSKGTATIERGRNKADNADSTKVSWSGLSNPKNFTQSFTDEEVASWTTNADFDGTANKEKTFMVIPQTLGENAELAIYLASALHPEVLKFDMITAEEPALKDWSNYAGKMITFRINSYVGLVSVKVDDVCDTANGVKSNIVIKNDGNADIFVRAELVGNWINEDGEVLASWKEDNSYGEFESEAGTKNANLDLVLDANYWQKADDGFYYYKYYLIPGKVLKHNMFKTFTLKSKPIDASGQWAGEVKMQIDALELSILVQAVRAESTKASAIAAWGSDNVGFLTNTADN